MEEVFFNLDDINISEENADFITAPEVKVDETNPLEEVEIKEEHTEAVESTADITEKTDETIEDTPSTPEDDSSQSSTLYALAQYLKEEGALYIDEDLEDIKTLEELKALVEKSNTQAKYAGLNESQKRYHEALESGIPKKEYEAVEKDIQAYEAIKEEELETNDQLRFEINAIDLMDKGLSQEKAVKLAKLSITDESSVTDTKEVLKALIEKKKESFKDMLEKENEKTEVALTDIKKAVFAKDKLLDMPVNEITKSKLFDLMTTKVGTDDNGMPLNKFQKWQVENPIESNIFINYLFMMTNEGKDLGLIQKTTVSKASKDLEKKLQSMSFDKSGALIIPDAMIKSKNTLKTDNRLNINI